MAKKERMVYIPKLKQLEFLLNNESVLSEVFSICTIRNVNTS